MSYYEDEKNYVGWIFVIAIIVSVFFYFTVISPYIEGFQDCKKLPECDKKWQNFN